ncbi:hypothetical protein AB205_0106130, partial [Aquarana catesbeiana]
LHNNHLTDSSCLHLAFGIKQNKTLWKLDLSRNSLEGPHFSDLMTAVTTSWIKELCSCPHLASGIRNNQKLQKLHLSKNNLGGPHFGDLVAALTTASEIWELLLWGTELTDEYAPLLVSLSGMKSLTRLYLNDNRFSNASSRHIRDLIMKSQGLNEIRPHMSDSSCDPHPGGTLTPLQTPSETADMIQEMIRDCGYETRDGQRLRT